MARPSRADALATLGEGQARLDDLLGRLSEIELTRPGTIGARIGLSARPALLLVP